MEQIYYGTVLVVDDDENVLESISLLLTEFGYSVVSCGSGAAAIERLQKVKIDVVLTDIVMPGMSGIALLERIRSMDPEIPVVLMTAYADLDNAVEAVKKGAFDFIIKPYKPEQLLYSLERAVKFIRLMQMEQDYRSILEDLNQAFETMVAERTMSLMALTLADRVRNPATIIGLTGKRLLEKEKVSAGVEEGLRVIEVEAGKLEAIVREFQDLLKSRQSMFGYEDLNGIIGAVTSVVEKEAAHKGVSMEVQLGKGPLRINTQKNLLRVAVFHVLKNALEATPKGGVVKIVASAEGEKVVLSISDNGRGIGPEDLPRLFDPFFSTKEHRFGMGLPLVKQIVSEHSGDIEVESEEQKGTTFRMSFPIRWTENK